jgi:hypothetical protein
MQAEWGMGLCGPRKPTSTRDADLIHAGFLFLFLQDRTQCLVVT